MNSVRSTVVHVVQQLLNEDIAETDPLMSAGVDSLGAAELRSMLSSSVGMHLPGTLIFDYPSIDAIVQYLY